MAALGASKLHMKCAGRIHSGRFPDGLEVFADQYSNPAVLGVVFATK